MQFTLMGLKFDLATIVLSVALVRAANVYHVSRIFGRVFERKRGIRREKETAGDFYLLFFSFFFFRTSNPTAIPFFLFSFFLFFFLSIREHDVCIRWSTLFCSSEILLRSLALGRCRATRRCSETRKEVSFD